MASLLGMDESMIGMWVLLVVLLRPAWTDFAHRWVWSWDWWPGVVMGILLIPQVDLVALLLSLAIGLPLAVLSFRMHMWGKADAKAVALVSFLVPQPIMGLPFVLVWLMGALLVSIVWGIAGNWVRSRGESGVQRLWSYPDQGQPFGRPFSKDGRASYGVPVVTSMLLVQVLALVLAHI